MTGQELTQIIDKRLNELKMTQKQFCNQLGISSSAMSAWRNGSMPTPKRLAAIEQLLDLNFADYEEYDEANEVLQWIREDYSHRALFESVKGLSRANALAAASYIEKLKAGEI